MLRGLMLRMKNCFSSFFNVFKIFVKIFVHNEIFGGHPAGPLPGVGRAMGA